MTVHLHFLHRLQRFLLKVVDWHLHYQGPDRFAVVENLRILFLSLSAVKKTSKQADDDFFEQPFEEAPENELIFIFKKLGVACLWRVLKPWYLIRNETVQQGDTSEHFKSVEFDELENFFVEDFFVFAFHEVGRENVGHELSQEVTHIPVGAIRIEKLLVNFTPVCSTRFSYHWDLFRAPVVRQGAVFAYVVVVVKSFLLPNNERNQVLDSYVKALSQPCESENVGVDFLSQLGFRDFFIQDVLLEKRIFSIHMSAVK